MAGHMPRSGGSFHVPPGLIGLRGPQPSTDSPSSVSLTGMAGLEAAQGSLTSNALFGSLNLEELLGGGKDTEQQGRDLLYSMRAAEFQQRTHRLADGSSGLPPPHPGALQQQPEFGGFPKPETTALPAGKTSDDIWRGLGMDMQPSGGGGGGWPSASGPPSLSEMMQNKTSSPQGSDAAQPSLPPTLGGYLHPGSGGLRPPSVGPPGTPPSPAQQQQQQQQQAAALQQLEAQVAHQHRQQQQQQQQQAYHQQLPGGGGLGATQPSLASSISGVSSTGLTHGLGALGVFSSGSTEVASHLMSAGGSAWYSQLGITPPLGNGIGMRAGSGLAAGRPSGLGSLANGGAGGAPSPLQNAQAALQSTAAGQLQPGGSSLDGYRGAGLPGATGNGSHPVSPNVSGGRDPRAPEGGVRRSSTGPYPSMAGSPRFSSHAPLPGAGMLYGGELPQGGPPELQGRPITDSPPRFGAADGRPQTLTPGGDFPSARGAVPLGAMLPPPNLVIHTGGGAPLHRGMSANGRMQAAPASPPEADALQRSPPQPPAGGGGRKKQRSLSQPIGGTLAAVAAAAVSAAAPELPSPAGRGDRAAEGAAAFPDIPTTVPRVRAAPADDDFDLRSELRAEGGRGGRGKGKARGLSEREKEQRDLKRKEANRESAARSRDKRLKLIADLEVEVQQLKRQHAEFKVKVIESTVPRPSVETLEERRRALRRVRTDPADCEAHITHALLSEGLDIAALAAQVQQQVSQADVEAAAASTEDDSSPPLNPEALVAAKLAAARAAEKAEAERAAEAAEAAAADDQPDAADPSADPALSDHAAAPMAVGSAAPKAAPSAHPAAGPPPIVPAPDTLIRCAAGPS